MNIKYRKVDDKTRAEGHWFYPLLQVFIRHRIDMRPILALVDSGAADCVFSASLGEVLGIDVPSGKPHRFHAFNLQETQGFIHSVHLQVSGYSHWIEVDAVFIESEALPILSKAFSKAIKLSLNDSGVSLKSTLKRTLSFEIDGDMVGDVKRQTWS